MPQRTAILAGATGLVGSHLLAQLLDSPQYSRVTAITRRPLGRTHPKLQELTGDAGRIPELPPADDVFCALGTTIRKAGSKAAFRQIDHDYPLALARLSASAGATQFLLVSSVGADRKSGNFYLHTKGELENELQALPFRSLHLFQPSFLVGDRKENRPGERLGIALSKVLSPLLVGALRKYRPVQVNVLARAMVAAATLSEPGRHEYTFDDIAGKS